MDFQHSPRVRDLQQRLTAFMDEHVYPVEHLYHEQVQQQRWQSPPVLEELKARAREEGLWNLFMPDERYGPGLSNLEYAPLAEIMGRVFWAPEVFNCNAPDTGNMEVLLHYGTPAQQERWLQPLLDGSIRSAFAMTEPDVASSDATNVETSILPDGDDYVINGRKWFITNAMHERCAIFIVMGKSDPDNPNRHLQQSQILVPRDTPGLSIVRPLSTFGYYDEPGGHAEVVFDNVRVPRENLLLGEGRGFEVAQGRLGPGRIHHCMRLVGAAQRGLEVACRRVEGREVFGKRLSQQGSVRESVAVMASKVEMCRLLTLRAAAKMDSDGAKGARDLIAMAKIMVPQLTSEVLDMAIQMHGAGGFTGDYFLAEAYNYARWCRMADGPDQVHMMALGKQVIGQYSA
ncbi:acyl-CoA dehydrogenase family protein [Aquisalimonas lutea]|uniref:acyl-CoA dehydrogenase family protein n=1 Tax=Aquisalimonas lutea TaxID=1327750 RepID=UPI0025B3A88A|nr:acyl-CoA dehydrogenase family protein [Aquisalimonas lutea]MDN3516282.1 acyl-CoA dehydrogenase family protein [Aquisalimonas lutea]